MVVFGPNRQRIIKDPHVVKVIEAMIRQTTGFDIHRVGTMYLLDGQLKTNPTDVSRVLGEAKKSTAETQINPPPGSKAEAFVITKECQFKRDLGKALKET